MDAGRVPGPQPRRLAAAARDPRGLLAPAPTPPTAPDSTSSPPRSPPRRWAGPPTTACTRLDVAVGVLERMPALGERMRVGDLELAKATAFVTGLEGLTDAQCAEVLATVLDEAPELPLGQLRDRILDAAYAVDPVWAANRLAAATARARVTRESAPSGAVNLCGRDLPPDLAQDAAAPAARAGPRGTGPAARRRAARSRSGSSRPGCSCGSWTAPRPAPPTPRSSPRSPPSSSRPPTRPDEHGGPDDHGEAPTTAAAQTTAARTTADRPERRAARTTAAVRTTTARDDGGPTTAGPARRSGPHDSGPDDDGPRRRRPGRRARTRQPDDDGPGATTTTRCATRDIGPATSPDSGPTTGPERRPSVPDDGPGVGRRPPSAGRSAR